LHLDGEVKRSEVSIPDDRESAVRKRRHLRLESDAELDPGTERAAGRAERLDFDPIGFGEREGTDAIPGQEEAAAGADREVRDEILADLVAPLEAADHERLRDGRPKGERRRESEHGQRDEVAEGRSQHARNSSLKTSRRGLRRSFRLPTQERQELLLP
jgi:hypothetical protein